jgi:hypothetical protein
VAAPLVAQLTLLLPPPPKTGCLCTRPSPPISGPSLVLSLLTGHPPPAGSYVGLSSCNSFTTHLGSGQNVLSYSYYTPHNTTTPVNKSRYLELLSQLLEDMVSLYPGWRISCITMLPTRSQRFGPSYAASTAHTHTWTSATPGSYQC